MRVNPIKRSEGRSSVAAAAYRSGTKLNDKKYGVVHDYTRRAGVVHSEVMLPSYAPRQYSSREELWNSVEEVERSENARVAREVITALPYELTSEERIRVTRRYVYETFVSHGMCADFTIHEPVAKSAGKVENPHAHILLTTRSFNTSGQWDSKKRKDYILDQSGEKQYDPVKKTYKFKTYSITDWDKREKVEQWREEWAKVVNRELQRKGIGTCIDHRSYQRQGLSILPQVHVGVAAHQMESRGIRTHLGDINREVIMANQLTIRDISEQLNKAEAIIKVQEDMSTGFMRRTFTDVPVDQSAETENSAADFRILAEGVTGVSQWTEDGKKDESLFEAYIELAVRTSRYARQKTDLEQLKATWDGRIEKLKERAENIAQMQSAVDRGQQQNPSTALLAKKLNQAKTAFQKDYQTAPEQAAAVTAQYEQEKAAIEFSLSQTLNTGTMRKNQLREEQLRIEKKLRERITQGYGQTLKTPEVGKNWVREKYADTREQWVAEAAEERFRKLTGGGRHSTTPGEKQERPRNR